MCSLTNEFISPYGVEFDLLGRTSIEPLGKTYDQVSWASYRSCLLGVIHESDPARGNTKSLKREFS